MNEIIKVIKPGIRDDLESYWAMHFCSALEALYEHKQLQFNIQKNIPLQHPRTLANFNAHTEQMFLSRIRHNLYNWGLQYFLCHYLMTNEGASVFNALMDEISNNYNFDLKRNFHSYGVFVCGIDSYSGAHFLNTTNAAIFGYNEKTIANVFEDIKYVDLCFLITRFVGDTLNTAILGEVEGNNAIKLNRESFWSKKSSFCSFGIGIGNINNDIEIINVRTDTGVKTILTLGSKFDVVDDFKISIGILETFFAISPQHVQQFVPGQKQIIDIVRYYWDKPIVELIETLRAKVSRVEAASIGTNALSVTSVPIIKT
ncbi:hypothetical protein ACET6Z_16490 [Aeromonas veronii]|uniref:hypothetical protein n=1 Tax=Aeromonas veronii TaxID=654 RepID=UPI0028DA8BE3|nr:hypothetical protein [Aeromonas veronii]